MPFDPKKHLIRVNGNREYLPVAARLIWFRMDHPDWGIVTSPVEINLEKQYSIFSCTIMNAEGKVMATATKMENVRGFPDYLEKSETGSVGRALAMCGYGTQFAPEFDEETRYADAPLAPTSQPPASRGRGASRTSDRSGGSYASHPMPSPEPVSSADSHKCSEPGCPNMLTDGQMTFSCKQFDRPLCHQHQRTAKTSRSAPSPTNDGQSGAYAHAYH